MVFIFGQAKKLRGFIAGGIKSMAVFARTSLRRGLVLLANKSKPRQKFCIKFRAHLEVSHPQINVIEQSCFHHFDFRFSRRIINFNPDQVSSTAQTFISTKPSGSATARMTSSVMSVGTLADFFGQETQSTASSAIFRRSNRRCFSNSRRSLTKR